MSKKSNKPAASPSVEKVLKLIEAGLAALEQGEAGPAMFAISQALVTFNDSDIDEVTKQRAREHLQAGIQVMGEMFHEMLQDLKAVFEGFVKAEKLKSGGGK